MAAKARARLQSAMNSVKDGRAPDMKGQVDITKLPNPADVVVTAAEVNELHGTGTLLFRMFPNSSQIISLRSCNFYDGEQTFGGAAYSLPTASGSRPEVYSWVKWYLSATTVRRVLTIPYLPADPLVALAVKDQFNVPLCTYIMDDKNVCDDGISDELMEEMLAKSDLRLVIGPEMRDAYEKKYGMKFWVLPPLVPDEIIHKEALPLAKNIDSKRGVLLGNVWGQRWLDMLRETFRDSGYHVDWYCNQKDPIFLEFDRKDLEADGITLQNPVKEAQLPSVLQQYAFAVVPTDTLDGQSPPAVQAIAELSLPSRIPTIVATSHLPMLVLGSGKTSAARFVKRFDLGELAPYERQAVQEKLEQLLKPETQSAIRQRSAVLSRSLSSNGQADWIWRSLAAGKACDLTYETLMPAQEYV
jgi:hypothetical protein